MKEDEIRKREVFNSYLKMVEKDVRDFFDFNSFEETACPACSGERHRPEFIKSGFRYVSCIDCATLFVNPRPQFHVLNDFYSKSPSTGYWVNEFFKPVAEARREKIFRPRAEYVSGLIGKSNGLLIGDIGAGFGLFLEEMRRIMPSNRYVAIEPSLEMTDICRGKGFETECAAMEEMSGREGCFDFLTVFELLEHLHNPCFFLQKAHALLKPKGRVLLTTLSAKGFDILLLWEKSKSVSPPHHLNFFNPRSVRILAEKAGFNVFEIDTPGQLDWDIVEGMILNEGTDIGKFWNLLAREAGNEAKDKLQAWISSNNLSSHMRILAEKGVSK